jgi:hypothetical protein
MRDLIRDIVQCQSFEYPPGNPVKMNIQSFGPQQPNIFGIEIPPGSEQYLLFFSARKFLSEAALLSVPKLHAEALSRRNPPDCLLSAAVLFLLSGKEICGFHSPSAIL